jgi:hypothetical protein
MAGGTAPRGSKGEARRRSRKPKLRVVGRSRRAGGADCPTVDGEFVGVARPTAIAPDDVRPGVVLLDQMRLDRSERVRSDRRADGPGHGSSSISPTLTSPLRSVAWRPPPFGSAGTRTRPRQLGSG